MSIQSNIESLLDRVPKAISDDNYFIAQYWAEQDNLGDRTSWQQQKMYRYMVNHENIETLLRAKREVIAKNSMVKSKAKSTASELTLFTGLKGGDIDYGR